MVTDDVSEKALDGRLIHRVVFFSDAVFAIVLTLLVLELRPPEHGADLRAGLFSLIPQLGAFASSFAVVLVFWVAHLSITRRMARFDWATVWLNGFFLFTIALMPFASALLGESGATALGWRVYCAVLVLASIGQTLLWLCLARKSANLAGGVTWRERIYRTLRSLSPGIAFAVGFWLSLTVYVGYAMLCWALIFPIFMAAGLLFGPRRDKKGRDQKGRGQKGRDPKARDPKARDPKGRAPAARRA